MLFSSLFLALSLSDVLGILGVIELPFTIFGGYFVFRRIMKHKKVIIITKCLSDLVEILPEATAAAKELVAEYKKNNHHSA